MRSKNYRLRVLETSFLSAALFLAAAACTTTSGGQPTDDQASGGGKADGDEDPLTALTGIYTGEWATMGVDASGNPIAKSSWTDLVKTGTITVTEDREYVSAFDHMVFADGTTYDLSWNEGYLRKPDGSTGARFIEIMGQTLIETAIAPDTFSYAQSATPQELASLGFRNASFGEHVTVKVVTSEPDGSHDERITRVTTAHWVLASGEDRWTQTVTLQGHHRHTQPSDTE